MMRVFMTMLCSLLTVCSVSAQISRQEGTDGQAAIYRLPLMERAFLCCRYFEGWHSEKHYPYVGWGHKLLPNEKYSARTMTKRDADELLRKDLRKFVAMFRKFGVDSILLGTLAYNVGPAKLLGSKTIPKSTLIKKLEAGDRNIYREYIPSATTKENATPCCSNGERRSLRCCISHKRTDKTGKRRAIFNLARLLLYHLIDYRRIFSLIDIVEPFLPIGFQITLQVVSVVRAIQNIVINHKKYSEIMKKVFRKIQKGTTKMIERIKSLGEMETKQKCVVQRFEIIIPLHQKITTQYIASASFTCGFFSYRRLDKGFFATFFVRHHAH